MKKIFYILASAIVALGAVACDNQDLDNIAPAGEGLSFTATIDNTKTALDGKATIWEKDDKVTIGDFTFVHQGDANNTFKCEAEGVLSLVGQENLVAWYNKDGVDSSKGTAGAQLKGVGSFADDKTATFTFEVMSAFLKVTTTGAATLSGKGLFSTGDTFEITKAVTDEYIAIKPVENVVFSYTIDKVECHEKTTTFAAKKIYNLGTLYGPSDWEISDGTRFIKTATTDLFVAKNVKLSSNNFCLHKVGDTAWGAGAKYGLVTAGTKSENTAIGLYSANWANDITISNATATAHDIYFDRANSRLYVMTVGKEITSVAAPTHNNWYNIGGSMNNWGSTDAKYKFTYSGDNVWHIVFDFKANEEFKVKLKDDWSTCYGHGNIQNDVGKNLSSGSDNAKMKAAGTYEIWVIPSHDKQLYIIKRK